MATYNLFDCLTGADTGGTWTTGGCPGYGGGGQTNGPTPTGGHLGTIDTSGQCYTGTYVYQYNLGAGACTACVSLEIQFVNAPEIDDTPHIYVCRSTSTTSNWTLDGAPTGVTLQTDGDIVIDIESYIRRECDDVAWTFPGDGDLSIALDQTQTWNDYTPGQLILVSSAPSSSSCGIVNSPSKAIQLGNRSLTDPCTGAADRCDSAIEFVRVAYSEMMAVGTCPGSPASKCENLPVDFTAADMYVGTGGSSCDSVLFPETNTTIVLEVRLNSGPGPWVEVFNKTGTNVGLESIDIGGNTTLFPSGVSGCVDLDYRYTVSTVIPASVPNGPGTTFGGTCTQTLQCTFEICEAPATVTGDTFETCTKA